MSFLFSHLIFVVVDVVTVTHTETLENLQECFEMLEGVMVGIVDYSREVENTGR